MQEECFSFDDTIERASDMMSEALLVVGKGIEPLCQD